MLEEESEPVVCFNCEAEFVVHTPYEQEEQVNFCPFCGSEVEGEEDGIDDDDEADDYDSLVYR